MMIEKYKISDFVKKALHLVRINIPYLAELTHDIELVATNKIKTAGIFASGRLIYNPKWLEQFSLNDVTFIIAHEIMHLALNSHHRTSTKDKAIFNITHDFIINELLKKTFGLYKTPAEGLDWSQEYSGYFDIEGKSAEELMKFIKDALEEGRLNKRIFTKHGNSNILIVDKDETKTQLADQLNELFQNRNAEHKVENNISIRVETDVLDEDLERKLFPETKSGQLSNKREVIKNKVVKALTTKALMEDSKNFFGRMIGVGNGAGNSGMMYEAITKLYQTPWEVALQKWIENTQRSGKTYSRPSRRGQYSDFVRPGYLREGNTLHIVLDTSGSMSHILGKVLGAISSFCVTMNIPQIHILQCDTKITEDRWYYPEELLNFKINGFGGSDMSPGLMRLAKDIEVEYALVITDGYIGIPAEKMPFEVLWVLTGRSNFNPGYGTIMQLE